MKIRNITLEQYANLKDKTLYDYVVKNGKQFKESFDYYKLGDITQRTFGEVKELQHKFEKGLTLDYYYDYLSTQLLKSEKEILGTPLIYFHQSFNYLIDEIKKVNTIEANKLGHTPTEKEVRAGIEKFNVFGNFGQFIQLAEIYHCSLEDVRQMKYADAFATIYYKKVSSDFEKRYMDLMRK